MRFILAIDEAFLKFFYKIARAFARLTGKSNFFLAKVTAIVAAAGALTILLNFWVPVLAPRKTNLGFVFIYGCAVAWFLYLANKCDEAEEATSSDQQSKYFLRAFTLPLIAFSRCFNYFSCWTKLRTYYPQPARYHQKYLLYCFRQA